MKGIFILCQPATGSSLLSHTCRMCGMEIGGSSTGFKKAFHWHHLERSDVMDYLARGKTHSISNVFRAYKAEAVDNKYPFFGMKLTSFTFERWNTLQPILDREWGNWVGLTTLRHPYYYYVRRRRDGHGDSLQELMADWAGKYYLLRELINQGFYFVKFPEYWKNGKIKTIIERIGMEWNPAVMTELYKGDQPESVTDEELGKFATEFPDIQSMYNTLDKLVSF